MKRMLSLALLLASGFPALLLASGFPVVFVAPVSKVGASDGQMEKIDGFTVVGLVVRTNNAREAGPDGEIPKLWQRAMQEGLLDKVPLRIDRDIVVINSDYASDEHGDYDYTLGVRVSQADRVPDGFCVKHVLAGRYAVLQSEQGAPPQVVPALWRKIWAMTPEELGGHRAYKTDFEVYPPSADPQKIRMEVHLGLRL